MNEYKNTTECVGEEYVNKLMSIRENIEEMTKFNQLEILKILMKNNRNVVNENNYGIHINLSDLEESVIDELVMYINYIDVQEKTLKETEREQENYKQTFFSDKKDEIASNTELQLE